jgi:hypothetical protein
MRGAAWWRKEISPRDRHPGACPERSRRVCPAVRVYRTARYVGHILTSGPAPPAAQRRQNIAPDVSPGLAQWMSASPFRDGTAVTMPPRGCPISRVLCEKWGLSPPAPERLIFHLGAESSEPQDEESPGPVPPALSQGARKHGAPRGLPGLHNYPSKAGPVAQWINF